MTFFLRDIARANEQELDRSSEAGFDKNLLNNPSNHKSILSNIRVCISFLTCDFPIFLKNNLIVFFFLETSRYFLCREFYFLRSQVLYFAWGI